jgi:hypothetical protein
MKHLCTFLTLAIAFAAALPAKADTNIGTVITTVPFVINKPGKFIIKKNLVNPGTGPAIFIGGSAARDIVLDLNGFTLSGQSDLTSSNVGIQINAPNVVIRNGTVRKFNTGIMDGPGANGTILEDIICISQTSVGIRIAAFDTVLRRVNVRNVGAQDPIPTEIFGIHLSGSSVMENCVVLNIPARQGVSNNAAIRLAAGSHSLREIDIHRVTATALFVSTEISTILDRIRIRDCGTGLIVLGTQNPPLVRGSTIRDCITNVSGTFDDGGGNNVE